MYNIQMLPQTLKSVFHESANISELELENQGLNVLLNCLSSEKKLKVIQVDSEDQF